MNSSLTTKSESETRVNVFRFGYQMRQYNAVIQDIVSKTVKDVLPRFRLYLQRPRERRKQVVLPTLFTATHREL